MIDEEAARTIEGRLGGGSDDPDSLARTMERSPRATIIPRHRRARNDAAIAALAALGQGMDAKLAIEHTLGEGGMGIVHLAMQRALGRHVAVKTLRDGADREDAVRRVLEEAWITGALEHPNVVPVYDVGVNASGAPVIVMKRIEGQHWGELMHSPETIRTRFSSTDPLEWNIRILISICNAVSFAHSRGILHRDLKPENVMIGAFGEVYVLDWGIAVSLREDPSGRLPLAAHATEVAGTPTYMAPEMLSGDPTTLSERSDVYLLGSMFYEVFTGQPPHLGENLQAMISSVLLSDPQFPQGFPVEATRICKKAMSRDPADRFGSVEELRLVLEGYLKHRGSRRLAWDAKQSLGHLLQTLESEAPGEERTLAVFNLLGECRFGYRAALSAWPENTAARNGLDRALVAVIEHELREGDANGALALLREVDAPPADLTERVEVAVRVKADEDDRLKRLDADLDPTTGSRTRMAIGIAFGLVWTVTPLVMMVLLHRGGELRHDRIIFSSVVFLILGAGVRFWGRESLSKTLLNRRLTMTLGLHFGVQIALGLGAAFSGMTPHQSMLLLMFSWITTQSLLGVFVERWFFAIAAMSTVGFLISAAFPALMYPSMAVVNFGLTLLIVRVWLPQQDRERIIERRQQLRRQARRLFLQGRQTTEPRGEEE